VLPSIERTEPARTVIVPRVPPPTRGRLRFLLPWLAFGAVAVAVVVGSSLWSVTLRSAGRAAPELAGIGTVVAPAAPPPSVTALPTTPTTPAAATVTTEVVIRSPRLRVVAPPPAPVRPSVEAPPSAPPATNAAPAIAPDPAECVEPLSCAASSAPSSAPKKKGVDESTTLTAD
jgi:hypothetical protein